jgi:diacylglycerol kinase (ATP)
VRSAGGTWVILNPAAGQGRAERLWPGMAGRVRALGVSFTQAVTCGPGDAIELARQAVEAGAARIVVAGGDGTLNEVVNGCVRARVEGTRLPELALLPIGTGTDFARGLGIGSVEEALAALQGGHARPIDLGVVRYCDEAGRERERAFINVADFGLGPVVSDHIAHGSRWLGQAAYLYGALRAIAGYRQAEVRLTVDDVLTYAGPSGILAVGNGRYFGGGMAITPKARPDDGLLDVVVLGATDRRELAGGLLPRVYRGTHLRHPAVHLARGSRVTIEAMPPLPLEVDGEVVGTTPASFTLLSYRVDVLVPAENR